MCHIFQREDWWTSNSVQGWRTMSCITDICGGVKGQGKRSSHQSDACLTITGQRKVAEIRQSRQEDFLCHGRHSTPVTRSKVRVAKLLNRVTENHAYLWDRRACKSSLARAGIYRGAALQAAQLILHCQGDEVQKSCWQILYCHRRHRSSSITVICFFISTFFSHPRWSHTTIEALRA